MFIRLKGECWSSKQKQEEENRVRIGSKKSTDRAKCGRENMAAAHSLSYKVQASLYKMLWRKYRLQTRLADSRKMLHLCKPQNRSLLQFTCSVVLFATKIYKCFGMCVYVCRGRSHWCHCKCQLSLLVPEQTKKSIGKYGMKWNFHAYNGDNETDCTFWSTHRCAVIHLLIL